MFKLYDQCHTEMLSNGKWYILQPDNSKAWPTGYKTRGWATRTLKWLQR